MKKKSNSKSKLKMIRKHLKGDIKNFKSEAKEDVELLQKIKPSRKKK